jgi:hypothetical protein
MWEAVKRPAWTWDFLANPPYSYALIRFGLAISWLLTRYLELLSQPALQLRAHQVWFGNQLISNKVSGAPGQPALQLRTHQVLFGDQLIPNKVSGAPGQPALQLRTHQVWFGHQLIPNKVSGTSWPTRLTAMHSSGLVRPSADSQQGIWDFLTNPPYSYLFIRLCFPISWLRT